MNILGKQNNFTEMSHKPMFICINGDIEPEKPWLSIQNRSFKYGDGLFETMRTRGTRILFLDKHYRHLCESMKFIDMDTDSLPTISEIEDSVSRLLYRNKFLVAANLRLTIFRSSCGELKPENNKVEYCIESLPIENGKFLLNSKGLSVSVFKNIPIYPSVLSSLKTTSSILNVIMANYAHNNRYDDCLLLNHKGNLVAATTSNLFIYRNKTLYTPPLADGCVDDVMRSIILEIAQETNINTIDNISLTPNDLNDATEIFLTDSINGIRWIISYKNFRFYNHLSKSLISHLNQKALLNN